jgi:hypothetical protein
MHSPNYSSTGTFTRQPPLGYEEFCVSQVNIYPTMTVSTEQPPRSPSCDEQLSIITSQLSSGKNPYNPALYLSRGQVYLSLGYPDLASGDAYRALLLTDYVRNYSDEGELSLENPEGLNQDENENEGEDEHEDEREDGDEFRAAKSAIVHIQSSSSSPISLLTELEEAALVLLVRALKEAGCIDESNEYRRQGLRRFPGSKAFVGAGGEEQEKRRRAGGKARRFVYPWNTYEPDRFSTETLQWLNAHVVPLASDSVEVRVVQLPLLGEDGIALGMTKHLGVFATRDLAAGVVCMCEESALTVVTDPADGGLCEYCGQRWRKDKVPSRPRLKFRPSSATSASNHDEVEEEGSEEEDRIYSCSFCIEAEASGDEAVAPTWCSPHCRDSAFSKYHSAFCCRPIAPLHRAAATTPTTTAFTKPSQPGGAIYTLLLLKAFAMALTQGIHPLALDETKYLYGVPPIEEGNLRIGWGFEENVRGAVAVLEALGVDVFTGTHPRLAQGLSNLEWWDTWVVNTLVAKFRGVASGRQNPYTGVTEAAAAHTLYSLVNHDCEPNVQWECGGVMEFRGVGKTGNADGNVVAVQKGEELKSCYCDKRLGVSERREWMMGCLGGKCMCNRCIREEKELM